MAAADVEMTTTPVDEANFDASSDAEAQEPLINTPGGKAQEPTLSRSYWRAGVVVTGLLLGCAAIWKYSGNDYLSTASSEDVESKVELTEPLITYVAPSANTQDFPEVATTDPYMVLTNVVQNNLGGQGPDDGAAEVRYADVLTTTAGETLDLVLTAVSPYIPKNFDNNGAFGELGQISFRGGDSTEFLFKLVKSGTLDIVKLKEFYFTVLDIDRPQKTSNKMREMVSTSGYEYAFTSEDTSIEVKPRGPDNTPEFWGTARDSTGDTNPTSPSTLTPDQASRAVTFLYPSTGEIKMKMATPGGSQKDGRNFLFSGYPAFLACINKTKTTDLSFTETVYNNIGGGGPDVGSPEGMRFKDIFTFKNGTTVDLIVKEIEGYIPAKPEKSGVRDGFGCINMQTKAKANFSFEFVESVTSERVTLDNLKFTFLDMDGVDTDLGFHERIIMGGFQKAFVTNNTEVEIEPQPEGLTRFSSSQPDTCGGCRNPTNAMALTPGQQARTFTVLMEKASYFTLIIDISDTKKKMPRSIYFVGSSRVGSGEDIELCP